jgi:G3E family GTPase
MNASGVSRPMPVILLTGFLGAGKTTLLLRWLEESPATGLRIGIVMNEFGAESVDGQLVRRPGLAVTQVDGGCVCCAPDDSLERACRAMLREGQCDYLVLETSGLADPDNVIDVLTDTDLLGVVRLKAVVTVVDATWFLRPDGGIGERVLVRRQVQYSDVVALSRCDLLGPGEVESAESMIRAWNERASLVRLPFGLPDLPGLLEGPDAHDAEDACLGPVAEESSRAHLHNGYRSLSWRFPVPVPRDAFETWLAGLERHGVVRAKGFVRFRQSPGLVHVFQKTAGHHFIERFPAEPAPETFGVLIGPGLDEGLHRERVRSLWTPTGQGAGLRIHP